MPGGTRGRTIVAYLFAVVAAVLALVAGNSLAVTIIVVILLLCGFAIALRAAARVVGFARMVAGASRELGEGELTTRLEWASGDELGRVSDEFNRMASRMERRVNAAAQERSRLIAAIDSSVDALVAVDAHNKIMFANHAVHDMLGRDPDEMTGEAFAWVMSDPAVVQALRDCNATRTRSSHVVERPGRHYLQAIITPIQGGGDWASLVVFHDLTDVRRTELVRRDFVANVSHELRTPLAAVRSVIETLQRGAIDDRPAAMDFLRRANEEVERLVQMVEELLELSRVESGQLRLAMDGIDMGAIASSAVDRLRPPALLSDVELTLETGPDLPPVRGDVTALERAVVNLVHNAIKFTPEGGRVAITVQPVGGGVEFAVTDTGVGIDEDDLPRVFERFYKADRARRAGGTGLGLALVKHTVEAHGGRVEARSEAGHGATFTMWLPAATVKGPRDGRELKPAAAD